MAKRLMISTMFRSALNSRSLADLNPAAPPSAVPAGTEVTRSQGHVALAAGWCWDDDHAHERFRAQPEPSGQTGRKVTFM